MHARPLSVRPAAVTIPSGPTPPLRPRRSAVGFVLKRTVAVDLTAAVVAVLGGKIYLSTTRGRWPSSESQE
jgi:hypothetical protein